MVHKIACNSSTRSMFPDIVNNCSLILTRSVFSHMSAVVLRAIKFYLLFLLLTLCLYPVSCFSHFTTRGVCMWETESECKFENTPVFYNSQALLVVKIRLRWQASTIQDDSYYDNKETVTTKISNKCLLVSLAFCCQLRVCRKKWYFSPTSVKRLTHYYINTDMFK